MMRKGHSSQEASRLYPGPTVPGAAEPLTRSRFLTFSLLMLLGAPLLAGAPRIVRSGSAFHEPSIPDVSVLWVFLTPEAWEDRKVEEELEALGAVVRTRSRWLQALSLEGPPDLRVRVRAVEGVLDVRRVRRLEASPVMVGGWTGWRGGRAGPADPLQALTDTLYGEGRWALDAMAVPPAHEMGFLGAGIRVGILDGFFLPDHATVRSHPPLASRDLVEGDPVVVPGIQDPPLSGGHGTALWSLVAGDLKGVLRGGAPNAGVVLARVRDQEGLDAASEDRWVQGLEWLESQGVRVVLSGFGFRDLEGEGYSIEDLDGDVAPSTRAADEAARRGVLVVAPVGNDGPEPSSLQAPSDGDSVMAVGAVDARGETEGFSSRGPTGDGREKPDLLAPGEGLQAASAEDESALEQVFGTEYGAALLAGAAALFIEAHPERSPMEVLEALQRSVPPRNGGGPGVPRIAPAILFPDGISAYPLQEVDGQGRVTDLAPQFQWDVPTLHPLGLPVTFHLQFAEDSLFQDLLLQESVVGTFARRVQTPLPPQARLFWRIDARSVQGVQRTTPAQGPVEVPSWVALEVLNDPGGVQLTDPRPEFRWTSWKLTGPAGPLTFELQVLSDREEEIIQSHPGLQDEAYRIPEPLPVNLPLRWRVIAQARTGSADTVTSAGPFVITSEERPPVTLLYQNFPNPFPDAESGIRTTRIWFDLATETGVELAVFDMRGRLVRRLIPGPGCPPVELPAGLYGRDASPPEDPCVAHSWDGRDDRGRQVSAGVYLLRLKAGGVVDVRRIVFWP